MNYRDLEDEIGAVRMVVVRPEGVIAEVLQKSSSLENLYDVVPGWKIRKVPRHYQIKVQKKQDGVWQEVNHDEQ